MAHLIFLLFALALLGGFFALTKSEARTGVRFFALARSRFDTHIERIEFIIAHVDLAAFARDEIRHALNSLGHTTVHVSLHAVRAIERLLTRLVRHLRVRHEDSAAPRESTREFVKTLSDFKDGLNATHPEISDIQPRRPAESGSRPEASA